MNRQTAWLAGEISQWLKDGLIDESTAKAIASRYPADSGKSWGFYLLTAFGALVFGLGIILFFAYNWADLPKVVKLALVFAALLLTHGMALWLRRRLPVPHNLIEGLHLLGTMMFGAGIWLIAQIYNIDEHYPTAFMIWGLGALAMAWSMPSIIQGLLATVLIATWGATETFDFNTFHLSSIAIIAAGILPLAWRERTQTLLLFGVVAVFALVLMNIGRYVNVNIAYTLLFAVSLLLIAGSWLSANSRFPASAHVFRGTGVVIYGACLFVMTFTSDWMMNDRYRDDILLSDSSVTRVLAAQWVVLLVAAVTWAALLVPATRQRLVPLHSHTKYLQHVLLFVSLLVLIIHRSAIVQPSPGVLMILYNLILAAHCVLLIIRGTDNLKWKQVALGCITLCTLILVRFGDLFHSLLMRSLAFIVVGVLLLVIGHQYSKRKSKEQTDA